MTGLAPYLSYADSGTPSLGRLPTHWSARPLGYEVELLTGFAFSSDRFDLDRGIPLVRGDNVTEGILRWGDKTRYWPEVSDELQRFLVSKDDILIGMDGSKVGKNYAIVKSADLPMLLVQRVARLRARRNLLPDFIYRLIGSPLFRTWVDLVRTDPAIPHISPADIRRFLVPVPPVEEQEAILGYLNRETARIDALIEKKTRFIELLREKRQALITQAVTRGLDPSVPMKDSGVEWLGQVPAHWAVTKIKRLIKSIGQGWSPECESRPAQQDEWGVLKVGCVNGGAFRPEENKALPTSLTPRTELGLARGDVLVSRANTRELVGSCAVITEDYPRLMLCDKLYRLVASNEVAPGFLAHLIAVHGRRQVEIEANGASASMVNWGSRSPLVVQCIPDADK